jgi:hypothetical protein
MTATVSHQSWEEAEQDEWTPPRSPPDVTSSPPVQPNVELAILSTSAETGWLAELERMAPGIPPQQYAWVGVCPNTGHFAARRANGKLDMSDPVLSEKSGELPLNIPLETIAAASRNGGHIPSGYATQDPTTGRQPVNLGGGGGRGNCHMANGLAIIRTKLFPLSLLHAGCKCARTNVILLGPLLVMPNNRPWLSCNVPLVPRDETHRSPRMLREDLRAVLQGASTPDRRDNARGASASSHAEVDSRVRFLRAR